MRVWRAGTSPSSTFGESGVCTWIVLPVYSSAQSVASKWRCAAIVTTATSIAAVRVGVVTVRLRGVRPPVGISDPARVGWPMPLGHDGGASGSLAAVSRM
jgi:hypothetical protein